jgi:hypothetical protein
MEVFSQGGRRVTVRLRPAGPTATVWGSYGSVKGGEGECLDCMKSLKDGPTLRRSENLVRDLLVGGVAGVSEIVDAKDRS